MHNSMDDMTATSGGDLGNNAKPKPARHFGCRKGIGKQMSA